MTTTLQPGICRHCSCTADRPCRLSNGDECGWHDKTMVLCNGPQCINAEKRRKASLVGNGTAQTEDVRQLAVLSLQTGWKKESAHA